MVTYRTKNLNKIDETEFIERLKVAGQPRSVRWNDSIQLVQRQTEEKKKEEKHTIAQPNIEPTFLHKYIHKFHPFIQKLYYDNNSAGPVTDCDAVTMTTFWRHIDVGITR